MSGHTPTPWLYRPREHDDWGFIRGPEDELVAIATWRPYHNEDSLSAHRKNKTDPALPNAAFIVTACNSHADLVKALEEITQRANESGTGEMGLIDTIHALHGIAKAALATLTARKDAKP